MVLAEIPLWVSHGNDAATAANFHRNNGGRSLPGMAGFTARSNDNSVAPPPPSNVATSKGDNAADRSAAKAALFLLSSTCGASAGSFGAPNRAPTYSVDVHPDGTRFATAAGDGTVKIWSTGGLFAGKLLLNREKSGVNGGKKGKRREGASSRFMEGGNYVSSNSEDYFDSGSSSDENGGGGCKSSIMQQRGTLKVATASGVNDLTRMVRKKNQSIKATSSSSTTPSSANPLTSDATASNKNTERPLPPFSKLTQPVTSSSTVNDNIANNSKKSRKHHKLLCTISSHEGSVLSLRFSPSGTYLATAGDDSYVNIYVRSNEPSLAKGNLVGVVPDGTLGSGMGGRVEDIEHWNRVAICRGHHLDVVGLAWAPDESHLASCSMDRNHPVIVWKLYDVLVSTSSGETCGGEEGTTSMTMGGGMIHNIHPHKILARDVHMSTVKGVAFDPAGKFLATSGDDPAICIWRAYDDWGLEARVDGTNSGVFPSKKRKKAAGASAAEEECDEEVKEDDPGELANLSLFRRISFSPDGSHVCGTNATLRGKNIAAMISREGWVASGPRGGDGASCVEDEPPQRSPRGAANLVGHKQPVVASRHCPVFFAAPQKSRLRQGGCSSSSGSEGDSGESHDDAFDTEPDYATLVALGDKRGFVTVWSTKCTRPIFKMQCSESRNQVTDISWGVVRRGRLSKNNGDSEGEGEEEDGGGSLVMIVSLLEGYVVALHFNIPSEVGGGGILAREKTRQIFKLKYGIDDYVGSYGFSSGGKHCLPTKRLVDDAGPLLIENALQLTLEMEAESEKEKVDGDDESEDENESDDGDSDNQGQVKQSFDKESAPRAAESMKDKRGRKRICPVLMNSNGTFTNNISDEDNRNARATPEEEANTGGDGTGKKRQKKSKEKWHQPSELLQNTLNVAARAALVAKGIATHASSSEARGSGNQNATLGVNDNALPLERAVSEGYSSTSLGPAMKIPYSTSKIFSVDLTAKLIKTSTMRILNRDVEYGSNKIVADCTNSMGPFSTTTPWPSATLTISHNGIRKWKDIIVKAKCSALAANQQLLAVGTADGCLYLYGTSPTAGWESGKAYRAFPPFVLGSPVVEIDLNTLDQHGGKISSDLVVLTSDGNFHVYTFFPSGPRLNYQGSVVPAMQHMYLSSAPQANHKQGLNSLPQPTMARIQITDSEQLMLILMLPLMKQASSSGRVLQGFIYNRDVKLWMRVSDSNNFLLSDFYHSLPTSTAGSRQHRREGDDVGILAKVDGFVKSSSSSTASAKKMYQNFASENDAAASRNVITRSHCEDRLACSIALGSRLEIQFWLRHYAQCLSSVGDADALRFLVDVLLCGGPSSTPSDFAKGTNSSSLSISPSFFLLGKQYLNLEGKDIIRKAILPEMSKNRMLQRLTNEIAMELGCL